MQSVVQTAAGAAAPFPAGSLPGPLRLVPAPNDPAAAVAGRERSPRPEDRPAGPLLDRSLDRPGGVLDRSSEVDSYPPPLRLSARPLPASGHVVVTLSGRLGSSPALHLLVHGLALPGYTVLVLELTDLTSIDRAGVGILVALVRRAVETGRCLHLCADPDSPADAELRAAGLYDSLHLSPSPTAAVADCPCSCRCLA